MNRLVSLLAALLALSPAAIAQTQGRAVTDAREAMWWSPTEEDWKRPCLVTWQRTWDDAVKLSKETGQAILVCVNMDGEIASEHYAGVRYRQPEIASIYEPYVCVIASVYRHTPRDYDEDGRRIPCPRFGGVTCGEHIAIEPLLYERFMDGRRIAPRHIMVELDGSETYDVYYAFDTDSVFERIRVGIEERPYDPPVTDGEPSLVDEVRSPDSTRREEVEARYRTGTREVKRKLVRAAIQAGGDTPVDLLRLAVFDLDVELNRMARLALAQATTENAIGLINEALRAPMSPEERDALIAALVRLGETYPRARTLAAVHQGLATGSDAVDVGGWTAALGGAEYPEAEDRLGARVAREYTLESKAHAVSTAPEDPAALLEFAHASLELAVDPVAAVSLASKPAERSEYAQLLFEDVRRSARRAEELGASGWRLDMSLALSSYYLGDLDTAHGRAVAAVGAMPPGEEGWSAMAVLALFAQARQKAIMDAVRAKEEWPKEWLTDVNAAYSVLARHPLGTDHQIAAHNDFLRWLGAFAQAERVLDHGLERFPESPALHRRLRGRVLWEKGAVALEEVYTKRLQEEGPSANLSWFAGLASLVAAEYHRRAAEWTEALASYDRGIAHYEDAIAANPEFADSSEHYVAVALAGRARVALVQEDLERCLAELQAAFARKPEASASLDGLGLSAVLTAITLRARLAEAGREDLVAVLQAELDALDPKLLEPPEYDLPAPGTQGGRPQGFRRRR